MSLELRVLVLEVEQRTKRRRRPKLTEDYIQDFRTSNEIGFEA